MIKRLSLKKSKSLQAPSIPNLYALIEGCSSMTYFLHASNSLKTLSSGISLPKIPIAFIKYLGCSLRPTIIISISKNFSSISLKLIEKNN